ITGSPTSPSSIATVTMRCTVLMTRAIGLRSCMIGNGHVQFCSGRRWSNLPPDRNRSRLEGQYDHIIRSLYLLDYIDSPPLRRNVQRALNRGENYHQLRRAVSYANFGKLRFKTEYDQQVWEECSRLITNCIIYYNATILSHLFMHKTRRGDTAGAALLTQVSPVAWQHINLCGRYEFTKAPEVINIAAIIQALAQAPVPHDLAL